LLLYNPSVKNPTHNPQVGIAYIDWCPKSPVINDIVVAIIAHGITESPEQPIKAILGLTFGAASNDISDGINNTAPIDTPSNPLVIAIAFTIGLNIVYISNSK
jgi:hypothetical protein